MSVLVLVLLLVLWASLLLPAALRARRAAHPIASVDVFARTMGSLALTQRRRRGSTRGAGRRVLVLADPPRLSGGPSSGPSPQPVRPRRAVSRDSVRMSAPPSPACRTRRRRVLAGLAAAVAVSLVLAAVLGGGAWALPGLGSLALGAYLGALVGVRPRPVMAPARPAAHRDGALPSVPPSSPDAAASEAAAGEQAIGSAEHVLVPARSSGG